MNCSDIEDFPDFKCRDKRSVWIFKINKTYRYQSKFLGHCFHSKWLRIYPSGLIIIRKKYAWNGCSPKISVCDLFIIGTPDGIIDIETEKPKTYFATMIHDALYQYHRWHNISRKDIDQLFLEMMRKEKFALAGLYYLSVRILGWLFAGRKNPKRHDIEFNLDTTKEK